MKGHIVKVKKIIIYLLGFLFHWNTHASVFQLVDTEKDEQEKDSPTVTTYTYTAAMPLMVSYRYGFNLDMNTYELAIKFDDIDTQNTKLRSVYLGVSDEDQYFLKLLKIPDFKPKIGCYYLGNAEVSLDEVWVATFDFGGSDYGGAFLKDINLHDNAVPIFYCS